MELLYVYAAFEIVICVFMLCSFEFYFIMLLKIFLNLINFICLTLSNVNNECYVIRQTSPPISDESDSTLY